MASLLHRSGCIAVVVVANSVVVAAVVAERLERVAVTAQLGATVAEPQLGRRNSTTLAACFASNLAERSGGRKREKSWPASLKNEPQNESQLLGRAPFLPIVRRASEKEPTTIIKHD